MTEIIDEKEEVKYKSKQGLKDGRVKMLLQKKLLKIEKIDK